MYEGLLIYAKNIFFGLIYANVCQKRFILNKNFMIFELFLTIAYLQHIHIVSSITYRHDNAQPIIVTG